MTGRQPETPRVPNTRMTSRPPAVWLLLLAAVLGRVREGRGFSNGSVASSCETLLPGHHPYNASTLASPYTVSASASTYRPGDSITVYMEMASNGSIPFQGFILQAMSRAGQEGLPVGCFTNIDTSLTNTLHCRGMQNSSISHSSPTKKQRLQVTWEAPSNSSSGDIYFCASFVQTYSTFWVKVTSEDVRLDSSVNRIPAGSMTALLLTGLSVGWGGLSP
ncbi:unnamed protein product [Gadus morhua 'NCC']